ncbi:hypothetical protein QRO08_09655 [Paracidovorax citrulli]|uniref:Uncharacterized protein n=2 Tax=Paracidovorax citrulli TaxID=80869 RepID=A1TPM9_PARC0|nr:hypothetical protein [Paracidovorax citrulli]ABM32917.1 hypothetical protein Aave_2342 [Paracidovorax citrulli AAC00-1]ATG93114.1 hypothetical protein CQB05_02845 [Paracidovorax citrulli]MVT36794.1 hypothetical protein [Paracidovorax citrulli]PVY67134.1 hypothetical protein C8E08_4569 [Paracidovorax citrulli]REG68703.1 hypothetical protein C8E07_1822 [Paracidovorax citrulli]
MAEQYEIRSINDLLQFDDEQFARLLPDLVVWRIYARCAVQEGAQSIGFTWVDDGAVGECTQVKLQIKETGEWVTVDVAQKEASHG